jgi:hypothetical protein
VFPKVLVEWGLGLVNLGSITTVVLIASFALVLARAGVNLNVSALQRVALALLFYSMVLAVINRMSEAFSYAAFWHQISTRTVIFLALCALAASAGARGAATSKPWFTVASVTLVLLALLASGFACVAMVSTIQERSPRWESGPAPLAPHGDIEDPQGWIAECWRGLTDLRTSPQR